MKNVREMCVAYGKNSISGRRIQEWFTRLSELYNIFNLAGKEKNTFSLKKILDLYCV